VREAGEPRSGLDSAAAWAVRPFAQPELFGAVRETLLHLAAAQTPFGITPGEGWPGTDPWSAPTAWSAWALAALSREVGPGSRAPSVERAPRLRLADRHRGRTGTLRLTGLAAEDRRQALRLLADLRRAATPAGELPERVDARSGIPRSTTPLAWSHAFAILALRELWPGR